MEILENTNSAHLHSTPINPTILKMLFENYTDAIFYRDKDASFIANKKFYELNLIKNKTQKGKVEFSSRELESMIHKAEKEACSAPLSFKINHSERDLEVTASPVIENDKVMGVMFTVKDITQMRILETQRETFVASLGHDLKNPTLAQIRALELLLKGNFGSVPDGQRDIQEMVLDSCKYMNAMLGSLLSTYRNESGVVSLNSEKLSMGAIVLECIGEMMYVAKEKNVGISFSDQCRNQTFFGDKVLIKRVLMNLLSNGIKYAYSSSMIDITIYNEEDCTCFKLENKSHYITPEKQELIFARYVSFADKHKELGTGLGLYASQKIVEAHEGKIFVQSFEDERNVFGFKIPHRAKNKQRTVSF